MVSRARVRIWMSWLLVPVVVVAGLVMTPSPASGAPVPGHTPAQKPVPPAPGARTTTPRQPVGRVGRTHAVPARADQKPGVGGALGLPPLVPGAVGLIAALVVLSSQ